MQRDGVLDRLRSADPLVREAAIREVATSTDPAVVAALKQIFENDPDPNLRELAKQSALQIQANVKTRGWSTSGNGGQVATPSTGQASEQSGEQVYEMLWDCRFCGTTKLLGVEHRH